VKAIRIGTRGSALALWQARAVASALEQLGTRAELVTISTRGDRRQDVPLSAIGGKGVFVKEIHEALFGGEIDVAVHSAKDMPAVSPDGLVIAAALPREDPRDALLLPVAQPFRAALPDGPWAIGTGSPRRIAQLRRLFPAARFDPIRGNVDTRLRKLDDGAVDGLVLACAGLRRLGFEGRISRPLAVTECVPAPGQGIIASETRSEDAALRATLTGLNDAAASVALAAEQAVVAELGGGCQLPLGAFAEIQGDSLRLRGIVASATGDIAIDATATGDRHEPVEAGIRLARDLASRGARELLLS
jgi:hydroxymethylbilane synthase